MQTEQLQTHEIKPLLPAVPQTATELVAHPYIEGVEELGIDAEADMRSLLPKNFQDSLMVTLLTK